MPLIHLLKLASYVTMEHFTKSDVSLRCAPLIPMKELFTIAMILHKGLFLVLEFHLTHSPLFYGLLTAISMPNFPCFTDADALEDHQLGSFLATS